MTALTQAEVRRLLDYDPETGVFTWRERADVPRWVNTRLAGTMAGCIDKRPPRRSYLKIRILGKLFYAHRLACLWMTGLWPAEIDHRDCDGLNNRWDNLRTCTHRENAGNSRAGLNKAVSLKGVKRSRNKYVAAIRVNGLNKHLGTFETAEEAHAVYCKKAVEVFGEFARMR